MTISSIESLSQRAVTAVASYGLLRREDLKASLTTPGGGANFTATQADAFVAQYRLLHQLSNIPFNGFSAAVFEDKATGKRVIAMRGTDEVALDLLKEDLANIGINGFANAQAVEMYRYYKRLITSGGQQVEYTDQEKWRLFAVKNLLTVPLVATVPVLTATLAASFAVFKQELEQDQGVLPPAGATTLSVLSPTERVDVTGHSLGGHLALLFARFFPGNVDQVVTLNAPGLFYQGDIALTAIGYPAADATRITRIEADGDGVSEIGTVWPGTTIRIAQEDQPGAPAALSSNHSSVNGNDALALMTLMSKLDTRLANDATGLSNLLRASSNEPSKTYEAALDALRKLLEGPSIAATALSSGAADPNRASLYDNMKALMASDAFRSLAGKVQLSLSSRALASQARNDFGALVSLLTLSRPGHHPEPRGERPPATR